MSAPTLVKSDQGKLPLRVYHAINFPSPIKRKEGSVTNSKLPCESKRELLRDYMARVETLKVARQEITEILMTTSPSSVARSKHRIKQIKAACTAARLRFTEHRNAHRC